MDTDLAARAVALLDRWMARRVKDEDQPDFHHTGKIAHALGIDKKAARLLLDQLAAEGRIRREDFSNGLAWRSVNPLPHEPGGVLDLERRAEAERVRIGPEVILQRMVRDGSRTFWFDVETFPHPGRAKRALNARATGEQRMRLITVMEVA